MSMNQSWIPESTCDHTCVRVDPVGTWLRFLRICRATYRTLFVVLLLPLMPVLAVPMPGQGTVQRVYCRLILRSLGVRITKSGGPIRNLSGVLVVSRHVSWLDVFTIGALMPGSFVTKAELMDWPGVGSMARMLKVIPIDRANLRLLPEVVGTVTDRLRDGHTVVVFPEGTTWCGLACGPFRPAMFQAAVDAARPVQPLRVAYHHRDGSLSTMPAYIGDDTFADTFRRLVTVRRTIAHVRVEALQLPGADRRELTQRCEEAVGGAAPVQTGRHEHALAA